MNFAFGIAMIWLVDHAERSNIKMKRTLWNTHSFYNECLPKYWLKGIKLKHIMQNTPQLYIASCKYELKNIV